MSNRPKILVVDDTPHNVKLLADLLAATGYDVITAASGAEALAQLGEHQPDLVLLDVVMPGMSGYEVCRKIREKPDTRLLPVVMVTALDPEEERVKGIEAGADDFLPKPVNTEELLARVRSLLRIKELHEKVRAQVETEKGLRTDLAAKVVALEEANQALREAQAELVQSEKMASLGQLVAGLAHELNNPVGIIYASTRILEDKLDRLESAGDEGARLLPDLRKLAERSCEAAKRSNAIVEDLRSFSKLGEADLKAVDIHEGIESALSFLSFRKSEGIRFHRHFGVLPPVECYAAQLNQALMSLLQNACEAVAARPGPGNVWVATQVRLARELADWRGERQDEEVVVVSVRDDGVGIPPEGIDRIFDPFYTTKQVGEGTGLGLSIAYGIAQRHGGRIRAESESGEGTTMTLEFPLDRRPTEES